MIWIGVYSLETCGHRCESVPRSRSLGGRIAALCPRLVRLDASTDRSEQVSPTALCIRDGQPPPILAGARQSSIHTPHTHTHTHTQTHTHTD